MLMITKDMHCFNLFIYLLFNLSPRHGMFSDSLGIIIYKFE